MPLTLVVGPTIAAGQSLSDVLDCSAAPPIRIMMPTAWTPAVMSFQTSSNNILWLDLFDTTGREITVNVVPNTVVRLSTDFAVAPVFLKFRSGTRDRPVIQTETRVFGCAQIK